MPLDSPTAVQQGARAYSERGCVNCHGAPGIEWGKWSEGMRPYPPDLKELVDNRAPRELFFVVKHGIKMTGMPGFGLVQVPDREIWTIVAFLKKLPGVSETDYKGWTAPPAPVPTPTTGPAPSPGPSTSPGPVPTPGPGPTPSPAPVPEQRP
jgi:mono/diheme cytochrome c family protein